MFQKILVAGAGRLAPGKATPTALACARAWVMSREETYV
ncbi:hypothetical protein AVKW3434_07060 [Acidovorax sp. SUPP3434]|nr:hypothetical protein AVKW3434_07060 [Acidovorax sp. SUPP3434]